MVVTGKFFGPDPTDTEQESGTVVELADQGPLKPGKNGHLILWEYRRGERLTAYDASFRACGHHHAWRRESTRLLMRGYLMKDGTLPNMAPMGRDRVDAYVITEKGIVALSVLGTPPDA